MWFDFVIAILATLVMMGCCIRCEQLIVEVSKASFDDERAQKFFCCFVNVIIVVFAALQTFKH